MNDKPGSAVVAGHICLDLIPRLDHLPAGKFTQLFQPGHLVRFSDTEFAAGGAVANTGLALHILGVPTRLVARVGRDTFGQTVRDLIAKIDPTLATGIRAVEGEVTSHSVIIDPPGVDRLILHAPGANDRFTAADIDDAVVAEADLFHFGYPPVMARLYADEGRELATLLRRAKATGVTVSLDMAFPDPASPAFRADWHRILARCLPHVDIFLPSLDEILMLLEPETYRQLEEQSGSLDPTLLRRVSAKLLAFGAKIVVLKLGDQGLYLHTAESERLAPLVRRRPPDQRAWAGREMWAPCFQVEVAGTTGAGDTTIAGFLSAFLRGASPEEALTTAVAVGAHNVEAPDALGGIHSWEATRARVAGGWASHPLDLRCFGWLQLPDSSIWCSGAS